MDAPCNHPDPKKLKKTPRDSERRFTPQIINRYEDQQSDPGQPRFHKQPMQKTLKPEKKSSHETPRLSISTSDRKSGNSPFTKAGDDMRFIYPRPPGSPGLEYPSVARLAAYPLALTLKLLSLTARPCALHRLDRPRRRMANRNQNRRIR